MDLCIYLGKTIYVSLSNGYNYKGEVVDADNDFITLIDVRKQRITLNKNSILTIREVSQ